MDGRPFESNLSTLEGLKLKKIIGGAPSLLVLLPLRLFGLFVPLILNVEVAVPVHVHGLVHHLLCQAHDLPNFVSDVKLLFR